MINEHGEHIVHHHEKYLELHGEDKIVLMTHRNHTKLHHRLRKEGKCTVPAKRLAEISSSAGQRHRTGRMYFSEEKEEIQRYHDIPTIQTTEQSVICQVEVRGNGRVTIPEATRKILGGLYDGDLLELDVVIKKRGVDRS